MGGEKFTYLSKDKVPTWKYDTSISSHTFEVNTSQKSQSFIHGTGISAPSWNQTIDDTSEDWVRTWDWVFMTTTWDSLALDNDNWEDWG